MRAAPRRPRGPRVLGLGGGSPLAAPGPAASLLCLLSQLKFPFQEPPAQHTPAPGRALSPSSSVPAALPSPASAPDSYPTLGGPPGSVAAAHGGDRPSYSGPQIFFFRRGRPRRAAGRKCLSLEPRGEGGPLPASAWIDAGWPEGLRDVRETALPRATPRPPPGRQNREGLVPGRWLHRIPQLLGSWRRKARSPTARPSLRPAPPPRVPLAAWQARAEVAPSCLRLCFLANPLLVSTY